MRLGSKTTWSGEDCSCWRSCPAAVREGLWMGGMTGKLYLMRWFWWKKERERKRAAAVRDVTAGGSAPRTATHTSFNCSGGRGRMEWIHLHLWHIQSLVTENQTDCEKQQESLWEIMMWWFFFFFFFFSFCRSLFAPYPFFPFYFFFNYKKKKKKKRLPHCIILYSVQQTVLCTDMVKK